MKTPESLAVFSIAATVIASFIYFLILEKLEKNKKAMATPNIINLYLWRKSSGFIIMGLIPALMIMVFFKTDLHQSGLVFGNTAKLWPWLAGVSLVLIALNAFNSKDGALRAIYPEMRLSVWTAKELAIMAGGWIIYLTAYEFLFRGLLLLSCYEAFGLWPAVVINLALYSALHLPKGMKEAIAALPFGALICYLTIESGSILPAILLHVLQAVSCEWFCIYRNPEMKFHLQKSKQP